MYAGVFLFVALLVGAQADSYGDVGNCNRIVADETYDYTDIYPLMYVHSITKLSDSEQIDGIVVNITKHEADGYVMFKRFDVHMKNGSVDSLFYQDIFIGNGVAVEFITDRISREALKFYLILVAHRPECGVMVYYKCSDSGTLSKDIIQVFKKDEAPLSAACEAKVAAIFKDIEVDISTSYVLPYALKNYS